MKLILRGKQDNNFTSISIEKSEAYNQIFEKLKNDIKEPKIGILIICDEEISYNELVKIKNIIGKLKIKELQIYSNVRETIITGNSLKINSRFMNNLEDLEKKVYLDSNNQNENTFYRGTIRSGNRISSNGDLYIIGDVNPGAIVSAKNDIYVWGKLLGIAVAGESGNKNASIASLYLNPLQLRISGIIAVGPKEKPKNQHPEIAVIEDQTIVIKPYIVSP